MKNLIAHFSAAACLLISGAAVASEFPGTPPVNMSEPGIIALMGAGSLAAILIARYKRKK